MMSEKNGRGKPRSSIIPCSVLLLLIINASPAQSETSSSSTTHSDCWTKQFSSGNFRGRSVDAILYVAPIDESTTDQSTGDLLSSLFAWGDPDLSSGSGQINLVETRRRGNDVSGTPLSPISSSTLQGGQLGAKYGASVALAGGMTRRTVVSVDATQKQIGRFFLAVGAPSHVISHEGSPLGSSEISQAGVVGGVYIYHATISSNNGEAIVGAWHAQKGLNGGGDHPKKLGGIGNSPTFIAGYDVNQKYHSGFGTSLAFMFDSRHGDDDKGNNNNANMEDESTPLLVVCNPNDKSQNVWQDDKTGAYDSSHGRCFYYHYNTTETRWEPHPPAYAVRDQSTMLQIFVGGHAGDEYGTDVSGGCCLGHNDYTYFSIAGAPRGGAGATEDTGYARVVAFHEPTQSWQNYWEFHGSNPGDKCGSAVVATKHGSLVAIGCPGVVADGKLLPVGQIRVFELSTEGPIKELGKGTGILGQSSGDRLGRLGTFDFTINTGTMDTSFFDESNTRSALGMVVTTARGVVQHYAFVNNVWLQLDPPLETVDTTVEDVMTIRVAAVSTAIPDDEGDSSSAGNSLVAISAPVNRLFPESESFIYEFQIQQQDGANPPLSTNLDGSTINLRPDGGEAAGDKESAMGQTIVTEVKGRHSDDEVSSQGNPVRRVAMITTAGVIFSAAAFQFL